MMHVRTSNSKHASSYAGPDYATQGLRGTSEQQVTTEPRNLLETLVLGCTDAEASTSNNIWNPDTLTYSDIYRHIPSYPSLRLGYTML